VNRVVVAGVSHHTASVAVRERLALTPARTRCLVGGVVAAGDAAEAVAVSTCNRTELYLLQHDGATASDEVAVAELLAIAGEHDPLPHDAFYVLRGERALQHLYRVAAGLDSLVPGEAEILGQVREALALSRAENAVGPVLSRLFQSAIETGRRVRTETAISTNPASVGSVGAVVAREALDGLDDATILLVGAGKIAELCAMNLLARGATRVLVMNRTMQKAAALADRFDGEPVPMDELERRIGEADVVICATNAPHAIVHADQVERAMAVRDGRPLVVIDLAVPRDVDPGVGDLPGVVLHDIDALERVVMRNRAARANEAEQGEAIVAAEAERFRRWLAALDVVPAITGLRERAEAIRVAELARFEGRWDALGPRDRELVERLTRSIVRKLLHEPTVRLKDGAIDSDGRDLAAAVHALFDLPPER
jgi:glutamyl-tRNA reductase